LKGWVRRPAKEIWEKDAKKKEYAESFGRFKFDVFVIIEALFK